MQFTRFMFGLECESGSPWRGRGGTTQSVLHNGHLERGDTTGRTRYVTALRTRTRTLRWTTRSVTRRTWSLLVWTLTNEFPDHTAHCSFVEVLIVDENRVPVFVGTDLFGSDMTETKS